MSGGTPVSGIIQEAKPSKSGKTLGIKVNGQWYSTKDFFWQGHVGESVSFIASFQPIGDGGMTWANNMALAGAADVSGQFQASTGPAQMPPTASMPTGGGNVQSSPPPAKSVDPMQFMPFTSNTVAHAIQAGLIKDPSQIFEWASMAFNTAKNLVEGPQPTQSTGNVMGHGSNDFDDDIPF